MRKEIEATILPSGPHFDHFTESHEFGSLRYVNWCEILIYETKNKKLDSKFGQ